MQIAVQVVHLLVYKKETDRKFEGEGSQKTQWFPLQEHLPGLRTRMERIKTEMERHKA